MEQNKQPNRDAMSHEKLETIHVEEFSDTVREIIAKSKKVQIKREDS